MSPSRSEPRAEDQADLAGSRLTLRGPEEQRLQRQTREIESLANLPLRDFAMSPSNKRSDNMRYVSGRMVKGKQEDDNHQTRSSSDDVPRLKGTGRRTTTGDRIVLSRSKGGPPVARRLSSGHGPKQATVEDVDDMESTQAVDSDSETEVMWPEPEPEPERINSTIFVAKTAPTTDEGKSLSGRATDMVDPVFLSELSQHEKRLSTRAASPKTGCSQASSTLGHSSSGSKSSPGTLQSRNRQYGARPTDKWSPRSNSSWSSNGSNSQRSPAETVRTTPDPSVTGDTGHIGLGLRNSVSSIARLRDNAPAAETEIQNTAKALEVHTPGWRYGTPEMARGQAKLPVLSPDELQPRPAIPGLGHPKHLPRAEKLPMSGYELLASKLSASSSQPRPASAGLGYATNDTEKADPAIKPIYRRFESLNHRLLLHLQDELSELEEQLHRLDTADTQTRRLQNSILPASRRAESVAPGELQWHKTDILNRIGSKLNQYNQAISSFSKTQHLPPAQMPDIEVYRSFLTTKNPIAEIETRFLDTAEDLISLSKSPHFVPPCPTPSLPPSISSIYGEPGSDDALPTPVPHASRLRGSPSTPVSGPSWKSSAAIRHRNGTSKKENTSSRKREKYTKSKLTNFAIVANYYPVGQAATLVALAVLLPIVIFRIMVVDFAGRMAVVLVVGILVAALRRSLGDAGFWIGGGGGGDHGGEKMLITATDIGTVVGAYVVVMSLVAVLF